MTRLKTQRADREWIAAVTVVVALVMVTAAGIVIWHYLGRSSQHPRLERLYWVSQVSLAPIALGSLAYLTLEIRGVRRGLNLTHLEGTSARILQISHAFLEHPVARRELLGAAQLSVEAEALAEITLDLIDTDLLRRSALPNPTDRLLPSLEPWILDLLAENPGLRRTLLKRKNWYSQLLYDYAFVRHSSSSGSLE